MISNKTLASLFLITLNMQCAASTTRDTPEPSSPGKPAPLVRKLRPSSKPRDVLVDTNNNTNPVEVPKESTEEVGTLQELSAPQENNQFKELIEQGEYEKIFELGKEMNNEEFLKQLCPVVKTPEQYKGIASYLKDRKLVAPFYVFGNISVIKKDIVKSRVYVIGDYFMDNDLETALPLALKEDRHDRVMELLDVRREITFEKDKVVSPGFPPTSFETFVYYFLDNLAPWTNGRTLRRFFILLGDELGNKYHDILDALCQWLMYNLCGKLHFPNARQLLVDLIGQSSLLTSVVFVRGFLDFAGDENRSNFIKYGWRGTIQEGLKSEYPNGGEKLWRVMQEEYPDQFPGEFPVTEEARIAACLCFPTKQQKEDEWIKKNALILCSKIKSESISSIFPDVLWSTIFEYAVSLIVTWNLITSTE